MEINGERLLKTFCDKNLAGNALTMTAIFFKSWNDRIWAIAGFWVDDAVTIGHQHQLLELEDAFKDSVFQINMTYIGCLVLQ